MVPLAISLREFVATARVRRVAPREPAEFPVQLRRRSCGLRAGGDGNRRARSRISMLPRNRRRAELQHAWAQDIQPAPLAEGV
jgi:hypothetical protein